MLPLRRASLKARFVPRSLEIPTPDANFQTVQLLSRLFPEGKNADVLEGTGLGSMETQARDPQIKGGTAIEPGIHLNTMLGGVKLMRNRKVNVGAARETDPGIEADRQ
jgi:hypothetical protein